jgi:hypothetical protein
MEYQKTDYHAHSLEELGGYIDFRLSFREL